MKRLLATPRVFVIVIFVGLAGFAARNVIDPDVWWHLKTGEYIATYRNVPRTDPFSYTRAGAPWVAHEWLTDLLMYGIYRGLGWGGLIAIFAAITSAAFFLLFLRCAGSRYVAGILTIVGAWATVPLWGVRPQVLSLLLTSLWLLILERSRHNRKLLWWTLPVMLLWVNLHAGFALGIALLILILAGGFLERMLGGDTVRNSKSRLRALAAALVLNLSVVPLNPNGVRMYFYPLATIGSKAMQNYIVEWASPNFHRLDYFPLLLLLLVNLALLAWARTRIRATEMLLLAVSIFAALSAIRMIPLFVLVAVPIIAGVLVNMTTHQLQVRPGRRPLALLNAAIVLFMVTFVGIHVAHVIGRQTEAEAEHFPRSAVAFLEAHPPAGPIFNHYDWGGYLIWRLYPEARVFIDGRADLYGERLVEEFAETYELKRKWQRNLGEWKIVTVIVPPDSALATGLRAASGWTIAYQDGAAVVFSKLQPEQQRENQAKPTDFPRPSAN